MKILLVDDDEDIRLFARRVLESGNHEVVEAEDGSIAVELFSQVCPDLVIMDLMMPVMDGHAATKIIKEISGNDFVPVLFLTSKSDDSTLVECLNNGGDDFVSKPINIHVLIAKIDALGRTINLHKAINEKSESLKKVNQLILDDQVESEKIYSKVLDRGNVEADGIKSYQKASYTFNGDIVMSVRKPNGVISFLVGDFTGHGLPAAICSMPVVDIFYQMSTKGFSIQDIVVEINRKLRNFLPSDRFFSVIIFDLDLGLKKIKVWNAGMPDVLVFSNEARLKRKFPSSGLPLGIIKIEVVDVVVETLELNEGDLILCHSDGVNEAQSPEGEFFGVKKIEQAIINSSASINVIEIIMDKLLAFTVSDNFEDDLSLLSIKVDFAQLVATDDGNDKTTAGGNWQVKLRFETQMLQNGDPVSSMLAAVSAMRSRCGGREVLQFVLTELFSNAIEHGLLKLDSILKKEAHGFDAYYKEKEKRLAILKDGYVEVAFNYLENETGGGLLEIVIEDSGDGFDVSRVEKMLSVENSDKLHSRGINLIKSLSESVDYNEKGNKVSVKLGCSFS